MLTYRNTNIVFGIALVSLLLYDRSHVVGWYWYLLLVFVYSLILFYGSYFVHSNFYYKVICNAATDQKLVAISFDDGPLSPQTVKILQILKEQEVPGCFFCIGKRVAAEPEILRQIMDDGHIVGNHSDSHAPLFDLYSTRKMTSDLQQMNERVRLVTGVVPRLFRPPYGVTNPMVRKSALAAGMISVGWNIRSLDTVAKDPEALKQRVLSRLKPGAILLLHDHCQVTQDMLPSLILEVRAKGYEWVRLDKLLNLEPYA